MKKTNQKWFLPFIAHNMKIINIIGLFIVAVSIIFGWVSVHLFTSINEPIQISEIDALSYLKNSTELEEVKQLNFYHGTESYQIFEAINKEEGMFRSTSDDYFFRRVAYSLVLFALVDDAFL